MYHRPSISLIYPGNDKKGRHIKCWATIGGQVYQVAHMDICDGRVRVERGRFTRRTLYSDTVIW